MAKDNKKQNNKKDKNVKPSILERLRSWFNGIVSVLKKVAWPEREKQRKNVAAVLLIIVFSVVTIFVFDSLIGLILDVTGFYEVKQAPQAPAGIEAPLNVDQVGAGSEVEEAKGDAEANEAQADDAENSGN